MSNYSTDGDPSMDPETSILVSKHPVGSRPTTKRVTITTRSEFSGATGGGQQHSFRQETRSPQLYLTGRSENPANEGHKDIESRLRKLRPPQLLSTCLELSDAVRRLERQLELREEQLRKTKMMLETKERACREKETIIRRMEKDLERIEEVPEEEEMSLMTDSSSLLTSAVRCRYFSSGCAYRLPSMDYHEDKECRYRPTRCPSLTCPVKPPYAKLIKHIQDEHDGTFKGRDRICRNVTNHLVSSYVNIDKEPVFYKSTKMTWVANELVCENRHFFLECMRMPPEWHIWVYLVGSEREAEKYQVNIQLFREDEYGRVQDPTGYSVQRSYTGNAISIHRSKEEIAEFSLGFQLHDKQIRSLCGQIVDNEEQLFGYEVSVHRK